MPNVIPFTAVPPADVVAAFPLPHSAEWRREFFACHTYHDALALSFRMIRELERAEKFPAGAEAADPDHEALQLAFPWARAD